MTIILCLIVTPFILIPSIENNEPIAIGFCGTQTAEENTIVNLTSRYHLEKELGYSINMEIVREYKSPTVQRVIPLTVN